MPRVGFVRISPGKLQSVLTFTYNVELIELIKTFVGREWDPDNKTWTIYNHDVDVFVNAAKKLGFNCSVNDHTASGYDKRRRNPLTDEEEDYEYDRRQYGNSGSNSRSNSRRGDTNWADSLLSAVGTELADKVYKVMSRTIHPDTGGNEDLMKQLNSAYDRYKGKK